MAIRGNEIASVLKSQIEDFGSENGLKLFPKQIKTCLKNPVHKITHSKGVPGAIFLDI